MIRYNPIRSMNTSIHYEHVYRKVAILRKINKHLIDWILESEAFHPSKSIRLKNSFVKRFWKNWVCRLEPHVEKSQSSSTSIVEASVSLSSFSPANSKFRATRKKAHNTNTWLKFQPYPKQVAWSMLQHSSPSTVPMCHAIKTIIPTKFVPIFHNNIAKMC